MGTAERRERQKAELRDLILAAAGRIIADDGFDALTMRKIADAIEYSPATIYLYFESRDDIAMQLVRDGFAALLAHMTPAFQNHDPLERLRAAGRSYLDFARRQPQTYRLIFMENERFADSVMARIDDDTSEGAFDVLAATAQELIDRRIFRSLPAPLVAGVLWAGLHGIASLTIACPQALSGADSTPGETMIDVLVRGCSA